MSELHQSPEGLRVRAIAWIAIIATAIGAIAVAVAWWLTPDPTLVRRGIVEPRASIAGVEQELLEEAPRGLVHRARHAARLHRYGASDRRRGFAHVPIARAIDLAAAGCRPPGAGEAAFDRAGDASCPEPASEEP